MKRNLILAVTAAVLLVVGCLKAGELAFRSIIIRSPYADEQTNIVQRITTPKDLTAFDAVLHSANEVGKPYPTLAPIIRFELVGQETKTYDFCPYDRGPNILCWHDSKMIAVPVTNLMLWCNGVGLDFGKKMKIPNQPSDRKR